MGGFIPNFTSAPNNASSSSASLPPPPTFTSPAAGGPTTGGSNAYGGFSFAAGGSLPGQSTIQASPTIDPALTNQLLGYLGGNIGQGLPAFNQSVALPSGGQTQPGQLTAGLNPVLQSVEQFMTGAGGPGSLPGVMPMWQSEMAAMQQPIQQNLAQLREQFGSMGALGSSEFAQAGQNYMSQTSADEMALLTSATMAALPTMTTTGMDLQGIDQSAISNAYNQFMTDLPQNNPLMGDMMTAGFTFPGTYNKPPTELQALAGQAGNILSSAGPTAGAIGESVTGGQLPSWLTLALGM
jgi:hypothetical protein